MDVVAQWCIAVWCGVPGSDQEVAGTVRIKSVTVGRQ